MVMAPFRDTGDHKGRIKEQRRQLTLLVVLACTGGWAWSFTRIVLLICSIALEKSHGQPILQMQNLSSQEDIQLPQVHAAKSVQAGERLSWGSAGAGKVTTSSHFSKEGGVLSSLRTRVLTNQVAKLQDEHWYIHIFIHTVWTGLFSKCWLLSHIASQHQMPMVNEKFPVPKFKYRF